MKSAASFDWKAIGKITAGATTGFLLFWITSHEKSPVHRKLPKKQIKNVYFLPHLKIVRKEKEYHFHHWMNMGSLYLLLLATKKDLLKNRFLHSFLLGSIIQGLCYQDSLKFVYAKKG